MSKIAELLKLAEQKKDEELKFEVITSPAQTTADRITKSKQVGVSKGRYEGARISKGNTEQVSVSKPKEIYNNANIKKVETSPTKDFTKVSNSIMKQAIPEKYFRGLSKHTYDVLYQRTRGAIKPTRTIQLTKDQLVQLTGLSKDAIKLHIKYLKEIGLLDSRPVIGNHAGWEYEIFVPEEIEDSRLVGVRQGKIKQGKIKQDRASVNLPLHKEQNLPLLTHTNLVENKHTYEIPKTSFKDIENNDDEPFGKMTEILANVFEKVSGKRPQKSDSAKLTELAELLAMELEIAAARTKSISNVPAFLTEHLRRRLLGSSVKSTEGKLKAVKSTKAGNSDNVVEEYEAEPLTEQGREAVLKTMQEYVGKGQREFVMSLQESYTEEDWNWLMRELEKDNK